MCGICFVCSCHNYSSCNSVDTVSDAGDGQNGNDHGCEQGIKLVGSDDGLLQHRGPDASSCTQIILPGNLQGFMQGCVLHLRGELTPQPVKSPMGNTLLWNGEIFGGIEVKENENDTQILFDTLESCTKAETVLETFQKIHGPWAFIYWQAESQTLWFGRDMFGRRSLLWHLPEHPSDDFILSSVALNEKTHKEIPSVGIFSVKFSQLENQGHQLASNAMTLPNLILHPWPDCRWPGTRQHVLDTTGEDLMKFLYPCGAENCPVSISVSVNETPALSRWIPTLTSGLSKSDGVETFVSSAQNASSSPLLGEKTDSVFQGSIQNKDKQQKKEDKSGVVSPSIQKDLDSVLVQILQERPDLHTLVDECITALQAAVDTRVRSLTHLKKLQTCKSFTDASSKLQVQESTARVAVLFSGGLDSTLVAALADRCVPQGEPIDLLNVAFEQSPPLPQRQKCKKTGKVSDTQESKETFAKVWKKFWYRGS